MTASSSSGDLGHTSQEEWWTLAWRSNTIKPTSISRITPWHHFTDHDVVFWRSGWDAQATAVAFKCGPPEGHDATHLIAMMPDWHTEEGHVHPDVNSFILWAHGQYLTGDSGYAGVPKTVEHNTLLVDGKGQGNEGKGHDAWAGFPYERLNDVHITKAHLTSEGFELQGEGAGAYDPSLQLTKYLRTLSLTKGGALKVSDTIAGMLPHSYTEVLHSDKDIKTVAKQSFETTINGVPLHIALLLPGDTINKVEQNVVMGPGRPGSVDKGTPESRGERLTVTTPSREVNSEFQWALSF